MNRGNNLVLNFGVYNARLNRFMGTIQEELVDTYSFSSKKEIICRVRFSNGTANIAEGRGNSMNQAYRRAVCDLLVATRQSVESIPENLTPQDAMLRVLLQTFKLTNVQIRVRDQRVFELFIKETLTNFSFVRSNEDDILARQRLASSFFQELGNFTGLEFIPPRLRGPF